MIRTAAVTAGTLPARPRSLVADHEYRTRGVGDDPVEDVAEEALPKRRFGLADKDGIGATLLIHRGSVEILGRWNFSSARAEYRVRIGRVRGFSYESL